jgi:ABC-type nickel/cobalt efflux system permease component RcnA
VRAIIDSLRSGNYSTITVLTLLAVALLAGFLHAFTPGHGKALVAAYLVANQSNLFQAAALGLLVTLTHTASIYLFGALSFTATYLFLPSRVIPLTMLVSGSLIVGLGLWMLLGRMLGLSVNHAHLIANLSVLKEHDANVLLDGSAAGASELLIIAAEEPPVRAALQAAGAEGITLCSLGCETHGLSRFVKAERLNMPLIRRAVKTGAVDSLVVGCEKREKAVGRLLGRLEKDRIAAPPGSVKEAIGLLLNCIKRFPRRGRIAIPEQKLSWKNLASMGFIGGMVPCPDALAILLVALSIGQIAMGMTIVLCFSAGLSLALISLGILIVIGHRLISQSSPVKRLSGFMPYITSAFITCLGVVMILKTVPRL